MPKPQWDDWVAGVALVIILIATPLIVWGLGGPL
jgi:hypothetical protein